MGGIKSYVFVISLFYLGSVGGGEILCEIGFCKDFRIKTGCLLPSPECAINNSTHQGMWSPSPTTCNCCEYCLPLYGQDQHCSLGGPGMGTNVGRCGPGLTCVRNEDDGLGYCRRMESDCHSAQDDFETRHESGELGALESSPVCDGKGRYGHYSCVPTQTCFCQSEEGKRLFGEVLNLGASIVQNMHCGCSKVHEKIEKNIASGVRFPVIGPRCTSDGNFNPVQCINRTCYCVDKVSGAVIGENSINLDHNNITRLPCYDRTLDLFPSQSEGRGPFNYTTPCFEEVRQKVEFLQQSERDGFNIDLNDISGCLPDGTYSRVFETRSGTRICIDETGRQIGEYEALADTQQFTDMDCKCALTSTLMESSTERPVCCNNGNFRTIQCRRGLCRCVDSDGKQYGRESAIVTSLPCYKEDWREMNSTNCYSK